MVEQHFFLIRQENARQIKKKKFFAIFQSKIFRPLTKSRDEEVAKSINYRFCQDFPQKSLGIDTHPGTTSNMT